jgi:hypothetical protein
MNAPDLWKNFKLGEEISVSGAFIYNGLRRYHEMKSLDFTDEVFEFLYNLSVGFERLLKVAVVLFEHDDSIDQSELEKSLITHSHLDLLARLKKYVKINLGSPQIDLLVLLGKFYKTLRYDRFSISSACDTQKERRAFCELLQKYLKVEFTERPSIIGTQNNDQYRKFVQRTVLSISKTLYKIVKEQASSINLYTYELRYGSKAESIFLREVNISEEDILWKELLVFFMNTKSSSGYLDFLRKIQPLDFDPGAIGDYLDCFQSDAAKAFVMDELKHHYSEMEEKAKERLELVGVIGAPNVDFDSDNEYDEEELE